MRALLTITAAILLLSSCVSVQKKRSRAHDFFRDHPTELAELCADKFPPSIEYRPGKPVIKSDTTIITDTVTIRVDCPDGTQVDCPPARNIIIRDTMFVTDTIYKENTARIEELLLKAERSERLHIVEQALRQEAESRASKRGWALAGLLTVIVLYFILKGRRII